MSSCWRLSKGPDAGIEGTGDAKSAEDLDGGHPAVVNAALAPPGLTQSLSAEDKLVDRKEQVHGFLIQQG